MSKIADNYFGD